MPGKKRTLMNLPIGEEMALRLHECGSEEDQARLVYALSVCLDERERWICQGLKKPAELIRWALAGYDRWGLAKEFEPMRRLARCEAMRLLMQTAGGRINESLSPRVGHVWAMALIPPRFDHVYWAVFLVVSAGVAWLGSDASEWAWLTRGGWAAAGVWMGVCALFFAMLKGSVYVWQDSSSSMPEGITALGWGRAPREAAIASLSSMQCAAAGEAAELRGPKNPLALAGKARRGALTPLEALEVSRVAKRAKAWHEDWIKIEERMAHRGGHAIAESKQPGWALARLEEMELGAALEKQSPGLVNGGKGRNRL